MRLAVISDVHGNLTALEAVLKDLDALGEVDAIWCLGDLAVFGPRPAECVQRVFALREQYGKDKVTIIGGNTDRYLVTGERMSAPPLRKQNSDKNDATDDDEEPRENELRLAKFRRNLATVDAIINWNRDQLAWADYEHLRDILGREARLKAEGYGMVIGYHGIPGDDESNALRPDSDDEEARDALLDREGRLGIGGHTHRQMDRALDPWRAVNVGSVGLSFGQPGLAEWGLFTFEKGELQVDLRALPYDHDALRDELHASGHPHPDWCLQRIRA